MEFSPDFSSESYKMIKQYIIKNLIPENLYSGWWQVSFHVTDNRTLGIRVKIDDWKYMSASADLGMPLPKGFGHFMQELKRDINHYRLVITKACYESFDSAAR